MTTQEATARLSKCDECGEMRNDCLLSVVERTMGDSGGYALHDVPVGAGNLCGECRKDQGAVPETDFCGPAALHVCQVCDGYGYLEAMRIGLTGQASPRYGKQRCDACDGKGKVFA